MHQVKHQHTHSTEVGGQGVQDATKSVPSASTWSTAALCKQLYPLHLSIRSICASPAPARMRPCEWLQAIGREVACTRLPNIRTQLLQVSRTRHMSNLVCRSSAFLSVLKAGFPYSPDHHHQLHDQPSGSGVGWTGDWSVHLPGSCPSGRLIQRPLL